MTEVKYDMLILRGSSIPIVEVLKSATIRAVSLQKYALSCYMNIIVLYSRDSEGVGMVEEILDLIYIYSPTNLVIATSRYWVILYYR